MTDNQTKAKKRWRPRISHVLLVLLVLGIAWYASFRIRLKLQLRTRFEAIGAAGRPVTCAELNDWYTIPENAENAAYIIMDAASFFQEWSHKQGELLPLVGRGALPGRTEPLAEETKSLIAACLADNRQAIQLLHKASAVEHCRFPVDLSKGFATLMPNLGNMRRAVMLLCLEAILSAETGRAEQAVRSLRSVFALARALSKEPMLIPQWIRLHSQRRTVSALERVINRTELTDEQLLELNKLLAEAEYPQALSRAFIGSRCGGIDLCTYPTAEKWHLVQDSAPMPLIVLCKFVGLLDKGMITYLDVMDGYIEAVQLPLHERYDASQALDIKARETFLLRNISSVGVQSTKLALRDIAGLRAAGVALAVQRYRLAAGGLAETLAELVPKYLDTVPKDPFDGDDMRYEKLAAGFVVYSVGKDLSDDGGKEEPPMTKGHREPGNYDMTFIVER